MRIVVHLGICGMDYRITELIPERIVVTIEAFTLFPNWWG